MGRETAANTASTIRRLRHLRCPANATHVRRSAIAPRFGRTQKSAATPRPVKKTPNHLRGGQRTLAPIGRKSAAANASVMTALAESRDRRKRTRTA